MKKALPMKQIHAKDKEIVRLQFNRQAEKFSSWSVTKNSEYAGYYYHFCQMLPEDRLLDISCGSGEFCMYCAKHISHATGIDLSEKMIAMAEQEARESGITNTSFRCGDAASLPNESSIFSIVISKSAFHHYSEHAAIFREMHRCCRHKGRISIQDIVAYDDTDVNAFFESFERLVDASHKATCTKSYIIDLYQQNHVEILSKMEVMIDLNLNDYLNHAVRSDKDTVHINRLIESALKDKALKNYFHYKGNTLFFKRNVFMVLGCKLTI
jgi:ubiquinone/menaquinone biosynthesis C-methylase UbiE